MLGIKKRDERKDERTNAPEAICSSSFFEAIGNTPVQIVVVQDATRRK